MKMKKKILEEIKKFKAYASYRRPDVLTESSLLVESVGILDNILSKVGAKGFSRLVIKSVDDMVISFKSKFGDEVIATLTAKQGKEGMEDTVEKLYKGESLGARQAAEFVESVADFVVGGQTVREIVSEAFEGKPIKTMWDDLDDVGKVKYKDGHPSLKHFSDDFVDSTFGYNIKKTRKSIADAAEESKRIEAEDLSKKMEEERLASRNKIQKLFDDFKSWMAKPWSTKAFLKKGINISLDVYIVKMGLGTVFAIFGGPIWSIFASTLLTITFSLLSKYVVPSWAKNITKRFVKTSKGITADYAGNVGKKSQGFMKDYFGRYILAREGMGAARKIYLSKGFWWALSLWGVLFTFLEGKYGNFMDWLTNGMAGTDINGTYQLIKNGGWDDMVVMSSLTGDLYDEFYNAEPVGNLQEFGVEFDDSVLDSSADGLISSLLIYKRWIGITVPLINVDVGEEVDFLAGYEIDSQMVKEAQESVLEFLTNSPSLLFISAVSNKIKEKTKGTKEGEHSLMGLIDEYHASRDQYLVDIVKGDDLQYNIEFSEIKSKLQGKPVLTEEMDGFIVDMYDSILKGTPMGHMKDLVEKEELNCEEKNAMMNETFAPTVSGMNDLFEELGYENGLNLQYDCQEDSIAFKLSREIDRAKIFKKLAKTLPFEGALYTNNDGLIATKQTKNVNDSWIELDGDFELIDIVGSQMGIDNKSLEDSSQKGMMFYGLDRNKKRWCPALIQYFKNYAGVDSESDIFVGGKCTTKIFKQMPVLKTLAAAQLAGFGDEIQWSDLGNKFIDELQKVKPENEPSDIGTDMMNVEESKTVGLGKILIQSRKNNTNERTR